MLPRTALTRGIVLSSVMLALTGCSAQQEPAGSTPVVTSTIKPAGPSMATPSVSVSSPGATASSEPGSATPSASSQTPDPAGATASPSEPGVVVAGVPIPEDAMEDPEKMADWLEENPDMDPLQRGAVLDDFSEVGDFQAHPKSHLELAEKAAKTMASFTPAEDYSPTAAQMRARDLMTKELYDSLEMPDRPENDPLWEKAAENQWHSEPDVALVTEEGEKAPYVSVAVHWDWVDESGKKVEVDKIQRVYYFTIFEVDGQPKITDFTSADLDPIANYQQP